jgi:hypothetical protein
LRPPDLLGNARFVHALQSDRVMVSVIAQFVPASNDLGDGVAFFLQLQIARHDEKRRPRAEPIEQIEQARQRDFKNGIVLEAVPLLESVARGQRPQAVQIDVQESGRARVLPRRVGHERGAPEIARRRRWRAAAGERSSDPRSW